MIQFLPLLQKYSSVTEIKEMKKKTILSWSSGKDSAWTLHVLRQDPAIEIVGLFSVINKQYHRASMHATRLELLECQAEAVGLQLKIIELPDQCTNGEYETEMEKLIAKWETAGIEHIAFGDLFLEDIRRYRENQMRRTAIRPIFPLWKMPTAKLAHQMLAAGIEAYISSVDLSKLSVDYVGRKWSNELLETIPAEYDPCGENGEMHTIVVNGPMFSHPIPVHVGEIIERDGFAYADIIPD